MAEPEDDNERSKNLKGVQEKSATSGQVAGTGKLEGKLIVKETRSTGSVGYKGRELFFFSF